MTGHADLEGLSAYVDGQAPEWATHVAACAACRALADELRAVRAVLAAPVVPATPTERDRAIAAALDAAGLEPAGLEAAAPAAATPAGSGGGGRVAPGSRRRSPARWRVPASVAAALLAVLGALSLLTQQHQRNQATVAGPALEGAPAPRAAAGGAADSLSPGGVVTDLGEVSDAAALAARARPTPAQPAAGSGQSVSAPVTLQAGRSAAAPASPAGPGRPCEEQARAREPDVGVVVYVANARYQGGPAVVLGFAAGPAPAPVSLRMLALPGCAELLRASAP